MIEYVTALATDFTPDALTSLCAALLVMGLIVAVGGLIAPGGRGEGTDAAVGLGAVCGGLAIWGAIGLPISVGLLIAGALGAFGIVLAVRRGRAPGGATWRILVFLLPFLIIAGGAIATMWDDFWHWLPNAAYLFRNDHLPAAGLPQTLSRWPSYPHTLPFIVDAASSLTGRFQENAGHVANLVLTAAFGATLVDVVIGRHRPGVVGRWAAAAAGAMFATALCPSFNRDVVFSCYSDVATAATVAAVAWIGVEILDALEDGREGDARRFAWRFAFAATALVNLKQANVVLLALVVGALGLIALIRGRSLSAARRLPVALAAPVLVFAAWRVHVALGTNDGEMSFRALSTWNYPQFGETLSQIGRLILEYPAFHLTADTATALGLLSLRRPDTTARRLAVTTAVVWLGYNAFLLLVYLGAMTAEEAANAADYWRYTPHVGLLALMSIVAWIAETARRIERPPVWTARVPAAAIALGVVILVPFQLAANPAFKSWQQHFRQVGRESEALVPPNSRVVILGGFHLDPFGTALKYDLSGQEGPVDRNIRGVLHPGTPEQIAADARSGALTHAIATDHFWPIPKEEEALGLPHLNGETALFAWTGDGWRKLRSWPIWSTPRN